MTLNAPELVDRARSAKQHLQSAERLVEEARQRFNTSVRELNASGASYREIAAALGISHQRVYQVSHGGHRASLHLAIGDDNTAKPTCDFCERSKGDELLLIAGDDAYVCADCATTAGAVLEAGEPKSAKSGAIIMPGSSQHQRFAVCRFCRRTRVAQSTVVGAQGAATVICVDCISRSLDTLAAHSSDDAWESLPDGGTILR